MTHTTAGGTVALSRSLATATVDVVKKDPACNKQIQSILSILPDSWGAAGGVRNAPGALINGLTSWWSVKGSDGLTYEGLLDPSNPDVEQYVCTGIARATSNALNASLKRQNNGLAGVTHVGSIDRKRTHSATYHTATGITIANAVTVIFDWHATLNIDNPMIFMTEEEFAKSDGITFDKFIGN